MKTLKYLFITLVLFVTAVRQDAYAAVGLPYFANLRTEITNQLTIASNTVPVNKAAITKLKAALKIIDKPTTNTLAVYTKTLSTLVPSLNKTTVSNIFNAEVQIVLDLYTAEYVAAHSNLVAQLATAFPGSKNLTAQKALAKLQAAIDGANTNLFSGPAVKQLASAGKNLVAANKAVTSAKNAPAPKSFVSATAPGTPVSTFNSRPEAAIAAPFPNNSFVVTGIAIAGSGLQSKSVTLFFELLNLTPGLNNVSIPAGSANLYTIGGLSGNVSFQSTGGTSQVTFIPGSKILFGTFTFNATQIGGSATTTITGSFSVTYP